jgi:hypothetical protein
MQEYSPEVRTQAKKEIEAFLKPYIDKLDALVKAINQDKISIQSSEEHSFTFKLILHCLAIMDGSGKAYLTYDPAKGP